MKNIPVLIIYLLSFIYVPTVTSFFTSEEICDNAIDDDHDGLIDLNDPDCDCNILSADSSIPNPSFEAMNCCPNDRSQLNCADNWIQASEPTTDYIHSCGWMGWNGFPPPEPFPDGEGIVGFRDGRVHPGGAKVNWKEYAAACLLRPLEIGTPYRIEFYVGFVDHLKSPAIHITFFGTTSCENITFGTEDENFGCPTNGPGWVNLGSTWVSGNGDSKWVKTFIDIIPSDHITAIAIGPDCPAVHSDVDLYYFFDNLLLIDKKALDLKIIEVSHPCMGDFSLQSPRQEGVHYQWYKDGIALIGETSHQLTQMHGEGDYQISIKEDGLCKISAPYTHQIPILTERRKEIICKGDSYIFGDQHLSEAGIYVDTFQNIDHCEVIVTLDLRVVQDTAETLYAKIFEGESYHIANFSFTKAGDHLVHQTTPLGCDHLIQLHLDYYFVYFPNVFSPNEDGINDLFSAFGDEDLLQLVEFKIFDRWGNEIFKGATWDGKKEGQWVNPGVFTYLANITMDDGMVRQFRGAVTVIR